MATLKKGSETHPVEDVQHVEELLTRMEFARNEREEREVVDALDRFLLS